MIAYGNSDKEKKKKRKEIESPRKLIGHLLLSIITKL